jgi:hypothetical protein
MNKIAGATKHIHQQTQSQGRQRLLLYRDKGAFLEKKILHFLLGVLQPNIDANASSTVVWHVSL